jgi:hypothetical protein
VFHPPDDSNFSNDLESSNLQSANRVVVVDPNWNPAWDLQAIDRAFRIGQKRDVEVFRLVSAGTIEEIVYARQIYKQQQAKLVYEGKAQRRYFDGVQNRKDKKGELFGLENMFTYSGDRVVLRDIISKTEIAEAKAGLNIFDLDVEDQSLATDEAGFSGKGLRDTKLDAISGLAKEIVAGSIAEGDKQQGAKKPKNKGNSIEWILAKAGVKYTHDNSEVLETSKIESRLSRRAMQHGTDMDTPVFGDANLSLGSLRVQVSGARNVTLDYRFKPSEEVRKRQFCTMARHFGYSSTVDFAVHVESLSLAQRKDLLDRFYTHRRATVVLPDLSRLPINSTGTSTSRIPSKQIKAEAKLEIVEPKPEWIETEDEL